MNASWYTTFQRYLLTLLAPILGATLLAANMTTGSGTSATDCTDLLAAHSTVAGHSVGRPRARSRPSPASPTPSATPGTGKT
jgi:hypothetical protein